MEVREKSSHYGLNMLGYTCATRVNSMRRDGEIYSKTQKNYLSSDCRLKLVYIKSESLVIVNQYVTVNDVSNFAHTAHHARRVVSAGNGISYHKSTLLASVASLRRESTVLLVKV